MTEEQRWHYAGVDWASEAHEVCVIDEGGDVVGRRSFRHDGEGLNELAAWLTGLSAGDASRLRVAIEVPHGAVVETLLERGFGVYSINPKQLDRFRDRFSMSGAKDDRRDALVLADSLRTDEKCFRALQVDDPVIIELREWSRMREELAVERSRLTNRMRDQLRRFWPELLRLDDDLGAPWLLDLLAKAPSPQAAKKVRRAAVEKVLKRHRIRKRQADDVIAILRSPPLTVAPGTVEAATAHVELLVERLVMVNAQMKRAESQLDRLLDAYASQAAAEEESTSGNQSEQHDVAILRSLPGVGRIVLAALLAEASGPLGRRDYQALRALAGVAPVTKRSGKLLVVEQRRGSSPRLRNAVYHWARVAAQHEPRSKARYAALRHRGRSHGRALRTVGDRLLYVACTLLRRGALFDPAHHQSQAHLKAA